MSSGGPTTELPPEQPAPQVDKLIEEVVDTADFNAVPEHGGRLQDLIQKHTNGEGSCPYIQSMGTAGVELVERLAESVTDPERGPTVRELMAAKKKEAEEANETTDKSQQKDALPAATDIETKLSVATTEQPKPEPQPVSRQAPRTTGIVMDAMIAEELNRRLHESTTDPLDFENSDSPLVETVEDIVNDSPTVKAPARTPKLPEVSDTSTGPSINKVERPVETRDEAIIAESKTETAVAPIRIEPEQVPRPVVYQAEGAIEIEMLPADKPKVTAEHTELNPPEAAFTKLAEESIDDDPGVIAEHIQEFSEVEELLSRVTEAYIEDNDDDLQPAAMSEIDADSEEPDMLAIEESTVFASEEPALLLATELESEEEAPPILTAMHQELKPYIKTLEPAKLEAFNEALTAFVEAVQEDLDSAEDEETEQLVARLLETIGIDYEDQATKRLVQSMLEPIAQAKEINKLGLTIEQLNNLGTHEHKSSLSDVFTSLVHLIKQQAQLHWRIGSYVTSFSFAN